MMKPVTALANVLRERVAALSCNALMLLVLTLSVLAASQPAAALEAIVITPDQDSIEITPKGELYQGRGDSLQVETAPGASGITGRVSVNAVTRGTNPHWIVFALTNPSTEPIERLLTADRYNIVGSGVIWPDLDAQRIEAITPSIGFVPERIKSDRADVFRVTLEPGQTITYVTELSSDRFARIYLWKPLEYELQLRDKQLFHGILLGLTGLLAIFLTAVFAANHKLIFPAAALVCWCVLGYLCVDFGFFHKLFQLKPEDNAVYRAASEAAMAASFVIFIYVFLRLALWNSLVRMLVSVWILAQLALVAVAVIDPRLASTFARMSFLAIAGIGAVFTLILAVRGQDRATSLIPTWMLFCVWVFCGGVLLTGQLSGEMAVSGVVSFLVLLLILIAFTITQYAFRSVEPLYGAAPTDLQQRALAVDGAGAAVWEWNARRDEIRTGPAIEELLGLRAGELSTGTEDFARHIHPADRERFKLTLWSIQERAGGRICSCFRMRHADNSYRWLELEAASIQRADPRALKCLGLIRDVTESKRAQERLIHDAVHDSLTGLPNKNLFNDRLQNAVMRTRLENAEPPAVFFIDIDRFKSVNTSFGLLVGDSLLLTVARRLQRHLRPQDSLARVGGDQFAMLLPGGQDAQELAGLAERVRRSLRSAIKIAGQDIILTGSMGIAVYDGEEGDGQDLLKDAEIAMYRAKRTGSDRIELFRPDMREEKDDRIAIESDLRKALERNQLKVLYQPVYKLSTEELAGFEALIRWEHPRFGLMNPTSFVPIAEESDLIVKIGSFALLRAAKDAARWQQALPREEDPLFVSVNVSSRQLFRQDLVQEIRHILGQNLVAKGSLKLEVTENLVMENPEQAVEVLGWLSSAGADLTLDDFGTGFSSFGYLRRFPFEAIKIDQSLLQDSGDHENSSTTVVRSIVAMAHELGLQVVAEGVDDPDVASALRSMGCEFGQGYYYGEAIGQRDVMQLLKMLRKSEKKSKPRSLFRSKLREATVSDGGQKPPEGSGTDTVERRRAKSGRPADRGGQDNGAASGAKPGVPVEALPHSSVRPRGAGRRTLASQAGSDGVAGGPADPSPSGFSGSGQPEGQPQGQPLGPQVGPAQVSPPPAAAPQASGGPEAMPPPVAGLQAPGQANGPIAGAPPPLPQGELGTPAPVHGPPPPQPPPHHMLSSPEDRSGDRPEAPGPLPESFGQASENGGDMPPPLPGGPAGHEHSDAGADVAQNGIGKNGSEGDHASPPVAPEPAPLSQSGVDYSKLPPAIAESLRRLAGDSSAPPQRPPPPPQKSD